jgi:hypothetical protein
MARINVANQEGAGEQPVSELFRELPETEPAPVSQEAEAIAAALSGLRTHTGALSGALACSLIADQAENKPNALTVRGVL